MSVYEVEVELLAHAPDETAHSELVAASLEFVKRIAGAGEKTGMQYLDPISPLFARHTTEARVLGETG